MRARPTFIGPKSLSLAGLFAAALAFVFFFQVEGESLVEATPRAPQKTMDIANVSSAPPRERLDLLFLHHSIGGQLLAATETDRERGGGLGPLLEKNNYAVHEATYGSRLGENTDLFDWPAKFRDHMQDVLAIDRQDARLAGGRRNKVVLFKSCYPNNLFSAQGEGQGSERGPELTVANGKAALRALLPEFAKYPDTLFVYLTIPPLAPKPWPDPLWKAGMKKILGKPSNADRLRQHGELAKAFNDWTVSPEGWLAGYTGKNVAVFDLFGTLTEGGTLLRYPSGDGGDSHPNSVGNQKVAAALVPFVNRHVRHLGLTD